MSSSDLYSQCFTFAQNGEKFYRNGDYEQGIDQFEKAIQCGTNDTGLLTAVYSQLGNAYYYLKNFPKAAEYHSHDLLLCRSMNDKFGEAFAYHNLALTSVAERDFVKALSCVACNMKIAKETNDKTLYAQAYCAKGLVYLQKAEEDTRLCKEHVTAFPVPIRSLDIPDKVQEDIYTAIDSFQKYSKLVEESGDNQGCGVAYANLGRAYFLLEQYALAAQYYEKRLEIARGFGNKASMRKAFTSLGNAHYFNSKFEEAIQNYQAAAHLAEEIGDKVLQAQSWYSVGNAATVGGEFELVISAYQKHFKLSRELKDCQEQAKSCSALAAAFKVEEDIPKALYFLVIKFKLAIELRNPEMEHKTKTSIRIAVQSDPESVIKNDRVILDPSADPDYGSFSNPESPPIDMTSISFALKEDSRAVSAPNLSEPLSKYILGCAKGGKPVALVLPMVDNVQAARSTPNVRDGMDFFERLERMTKQFDDQRADPAMLGSVDAHEKTRQADTLRANSASKLYDHEKKRRSFAKSVKALKSSFVKKSKKISKDSFRMNSFPSTSTPAHKRPTSMDCSYLSAIKHESSSTLNSQTSAVSTPEPSSVFRVPKLPTRITSSLNSMDDKENYQPFFGSSKQSSDTNSIYTGHSIDADLSYIDENDAEEELFSFRDEVSGAGQRLPEPAEDGTYNPEAILDLIASIQSRRMNEQRADFLPGLKSRQTILSRFREELDNRRKMVSSEEKQVDEKLYELIMQCQSDRIEEQRSALGGPSAVEKDVTEIVMRMAAGRMEEQRAEMKSPTTKSPVNKIPPESSAGAGDH